MYRSVFGDKSGIVSEFTVNNFNSAKNGKEIGERETARAFRIIFNWANPLQKTWKFSSFLNPFLKLYFKKKK